MPLLLGFLREVIRHQGAETELVVVGSVANVRKECSDNFQLRQKWDQLVISALRLAPVDEKLLDAIAIAELVRCANLRDAIVAGLLGVAQLLLELPGAVCLLRLLSLDFDLHRSVRLNKSVVLLHRFLVLLAHLHGSGFFLHDLFVLVLLQLILVLLSAMFAGDRDDLLLQFQVCDGRHTRSLSRLEAKSCNGGGELRSGHRLRSHQS